MTKKLKNKSALSLYQGFYDENLLVQESLSEGNADLMFHLQFFKKKLSGQIRNQQEKFDNIFFEKIEEKPGQITPHSQDNQDSKKKTKSNDPRWAKIL